MADPIVAALLGYGVPNPSGQVVSEYTAMTLSAMFRGVAIVAGAIAGLPLQTLATDAEGITSPSTSFLDNPGGDGPHTPYEWVEQLVVWLMLHGNAFFLKVYNAGGALAALEPLHPASVHIDYTSPAAMAAPGRRLYQVTLIDGTYRVFDRRDILHVPSLSLDGVRGLSIIATARSSLGTALAGDVAAARSFANGGMMSGLITPAEHEEDWEEGEAQLVADDVNRRFTGADKAGLFAVLSKRVALTPWTISAKDMQFLESRTFGVEEVGRWTGVPPHLLGLTEKATSWGQGITEQNRGLARYTLATWTNRIEARLTPLTSTAKQVKFNYDGFNAPSPEVDTEMLIKQVDAGLLTLNEARARKNLPPLDGGDIPRQGFAQAPAAPAAPAPEGGPDAPAV